MSDPKDVVLVFRDDGGEWRWNRKARNGAIVSDSGEGYHHKTDCLAEAKRQFGDDVDYVIEGEPTVE